MNPTASNRNGNSTCSSRKYYFIVYKYIVLLVVACIIIQPQSTTTTTTTTALLILIPTRLQRQQYYHPSKVGFHYSNNHSHRKEQQQSSSRRRVVLEPTTTRKMSLSSSSFSLEEKLKELGFTLPPAPKAAANYVPVQRTGNLLYLSGHLPFLADGTTLLTGRLGESEEFNVEYGYKAAQQVGLNLIATLNNYLDGHLDQIQQIVKVFGIVQSTNDFHEQHKVVNGCSDLLVTVFGTPRGVHARSAIGTNSLPLNITVEIELIIQLKDD